MNVLVIEDDQDWQELFPEFLSRHGTVLVATTLSEGQALFDSTSDICLIVMDGCVEGRKYDTGPLIRHIRSAGYTGPIIGATGSTELTPEMTRDGCDAVGQKIDVLPLIKVYEETHGPIAVV